MTAELRALNARFINNFITNDVPGHDAILHYQGNRVMMRCTSCGHDTPGWEVSGRGPRRRFEGDPHRHLLSKPRLVLRKSA